MLKTDFNEFQNDLEEVVRQFDGGDDLAVFMSYSSDFDAENSFLVKVDVQGKAYEYPYKLTYGDALEEKRYKKRYLKTSLYRSLTDFLGVQLPWGALTGIRPSKLAYQSISERGEFYNYFTEQMLVSPKKVKLISDIIDAQSPYISNCDDDCHLFLCIPLCPSRCAYCSFLSSIISKEKYVEQYVDALKREVTAAKMLVKKLKSVYIGGGTPVSLTDEHFKSVLDAIGDVSVEYTVEAGRPDCITESKLSIMKEHNVTRVCVNPQTFCDDTLKRMGRLHSGQDIIDKYLLTKKYGFDVNMDLIAGLIGEDFDTFKKSVDTAISLHPENITVHTLSLKHGSVLKENYQRLGDGDIEKMIDYSQSALYGAGYRPYYLYRQKYMKGNLENTGYALRGKECIYNVDIMEERAQIIASGANAVSKRIFNSLNKIERLGAPKDIKTYIDKVENIIDKKKELFSEI